MSEKQSAKLFTGHQASTIVARYKAMNHMQRIVALKKSGLWSIVAPKPAGTKPASKAVGQ